MFGLSIPLLVAVVATFFVAGIVKGVTGMGLPTMSMAVLGALLSPTAAAALLVVPSLVTNVWQLLAGPRFIPIMRRLWPMMLAIVVGTVPGTSWLITGDTRFTAVALGIALAVYSVYTLFARQLHVPQRLERWLSPVVGVTTGVISGGTGVFVIPAVPYLQALGLGKDDLVQALGLSFTVSTIALAVGLGARGAFRLDDLALSAFAVLPALGGMWAGQVVRNGISPPMFRQGFLVCLLALGVEMIMRPLL